MKQFVVLLALLCLYFTTNAQTGDPKLVAIVQQQAERFEDLVPKKKLDEIIEIYSEDAIYGPENNVFYQGRAEIEKAWKQTFTYEIADFNMDPVSVYGDKNTIYEAGIGYSVLKIQGQEQKVNFKYVNVWRKEKDGYKLVIDTYNVYLDKGA